MGKHLPVLSVPYVVELRETHMHCFTDERERDRETTERQRDGKTETETES